MVFISPPKFWLRCKKGFPLGKSFETLNDETFVISNRIILKDKALTRTINTIDFKILVMKKFEKM